MLYHTNILDNASQFAAIAPEWDRLLRESENDEPMLSPLWLRTWWDVFGARGGRQLCVICVHEGDRLVGLIPLQRRRVRYGSLLPYSRLEWLGVGEDEADEVCSDYLNAICAPGHESRVAEHFSTLLQAQLSHDELILNAVDREQPFIAALLEGLRHSDAPVELDVYAEAPFLVLPDSFDNYLQGLPKKHRYNLKRTWSDFSEWASGRERWHVASDPPSLAEGWRILRELHQSRWVESGKAGAFASKLFTQFHERVRNKLFARNALELLWLEVDGLPVAAAYNILWNRKVYFYQCGRTLAVPSAVRPGMVMQLHAIQRAIDRRDRVYDFLAGDPLYKRQMASGSRTLWRLRAVRSRRLEWLRTHLRAAYLRAKSAMRV